MLHFDYQRINIHKAALSLVITGRDQGIQLYITRQLQYLWTEESLDYVKKKL